MGPRTIPVIGLAAIALSLALGAARNSASFAAVAPGPVVATSSLPTLGFKDDVDVVVAPDGQFMVVPEFSRTTQTARIELVDLDPATGQPGAVTYTEPALGFQDDVDPIIVAQVAGPDGYAVLVPEESEDKAHAQIVVLRVDASGALLERKAIGLGNLGFKEDVDGVVGPYTSQLTAVFPLASEDNSVRGLIAIDVDKRGASFGSSTLLSSDGRIAADVNLKVDWLPGLIEGMDPLLFSSGQSLRVAVPVGNSLGADLELVDFDPDCGPACEPPQFTGHIDVKAVNAAGPLPLAFPGYGRAVHLALYSGGACGLGISLHYILVPVESPDGSSGDLYLVDQDGNAQWSYSSANVGAGVIPIPGYQSGVDVLPACNLAQVQNPNRILVPVVSGAGTNADLLIVDTPTGKLLSHVVDPVLNPGIAIPGWQVGVDPLRWTGSVFVLPVQGPTAAGLIAIDGTGKALSTNFGPAVLGYVRSVDALVAPLTDPDRTLFVPVQSPDGSLRDVLMFAAPPNLAVFASLQALNGGFTFGRFAWDVDAGLVDRADPGGQWVYLPEQDASGANARLRYEPVPTFSGGRVLVTATDPPDAATLTGALSFFRVSNGSLVATSNDVLGLVMGMDLNAGRGSLIAQNAPSADGIPGGYADRSDLTLGWLGALTAVAPVRLQEAGRISHANPFLAPGRIAFTLPGREAVTIAVRDVLGRTIRRLYTGTVEAGDHALTWDGRDDAGASVRPGVYFVEVRGGPRVVVSKLVVIAAGGGPG